VEEGSNLVNAEVFTMRLGTETIELLPLKTWAQLDVHKWRVQGKLPGTPAGLEITSDHVKISGETVAINDPAGCAKLERLLAEWLALERETQLSIRRARQFQAAAPETSEPAEQGRLHFQVELDKRGQVHIRCLQGKEELALIGLTPAGFNSLFSQGFMARPRRLNVGALHDWVELDGVLCSFERSNDDSPELQNLLNEKYVPSSSLGQGKDVVVYANAASSTGFDVQFPVSVGGIVDHRRRPLNEDTLLLLQDPEKSGLLHRDLIIKLARPNLIFKLKTPDGGERYLDSDPGTTVHVAVDGGVERLIDLSQPVNCLRLSAVELTAVFNHPAIHRHSRRKTSGNGPTTRPQPAAVAPAASTEATKAQAVRPESAPSKIVGAKVASAINPPQPRASAEAPVASSTTTPKRQGTAPAIGAAVAAVNAPQPAKSARATAEAGPVNAVRPAIEQPQVALPRRMPNLWLKDVLAQPPLRHDWFACLVYRKLAERVGNSTEGRFGPSRCWYATLGPATDLEHPRFVGVFLTEKGGLGILTHSREARFHNGVAFIGPKDNLLEGIDVKLLGVGTDAQERLVFAVADAYRSKFGVPESVVTEELTHLKIQGARILGVAELLDDSEPIEVLWTAPEQQANPADPQAVESGRGVTP
jgi:hypothetical protein